MKTVTLNDKTWEKLTQLKLDYGQRTIDDVVWASIEDQ